MKAPRDTEPFGALADALGFNWANTPVSCPLGTVYTASRGYGGAVMYTIPTDGGSITLKNQPHIVWKHMGATS